MLLGQVTTSNFPWLSSHVHILTQNLVNNLPADQSLRSNQAAFVRGLPRALACHGPLAAAAIKEDDWQPLWSCMPSITVRLTVPCGQAWSPGTDE